MFNLIAAATLAVKVAAGLSTGDTGRQGDGEASGQLQGVTGTQDESEAPAPPEEERAGGGAADEPAPAPPKKPKKVTVKALAGRSTQATSKRPGEQERDDDRGGGEDHEGERGTGLKEFRELVGEVTGVQGSQKGTGKQRDGDKRGWIWLGVEGQDSRIAALYFA
ncbi:hypothetical protein PtA15_11A222 [Puccinia triticina]|uniref:Uncharacterized protein n=1 Tax=Puccinia triticina TaxID=208348 RepID=A0ABY7CYW4_9BASI|nr:uncharacterized protein PtA15_11A222 [Puccinia triticina]WAQ89533.1 hypothetical protein PtA15_11A222 [Puccinia triticina]